MNLARQHVTMTSCAEDEAAWAELKWVRRAMVLVDVVESVRLMEADATGVIDRWRRFEREVRTAILPKYQGRLVKSLGDGMLLEFADAPAAAAAALHIQRCIVPYNAGRADDDVLWLRIGADLGDVVVGELDDLGTPVNVAARLAALAQPGQTLVTATLRDRLVPGLDADVEDLGNVYLKHIAEPVRAFCLHPSAAPTSAPGMPRGPVISLKPTLAVIPFDVFEGNGPLAMLGEAVADEVTSALSRHRALTVISRLSSSVFRGRAADLEVIREHLRADHVLTGRLHVAGDRLRMVLELVEGRTAAVIWGGSAQGSAQAVFAGDDPMIDTLVRQICDALAARQIDRSRREPMASLESYCLLMAAIALLHGASLQDFERARIMLEHLIERDRRHPAPHAWLAKWHVLRVQQGWSDDMRRDTQLALDCTRRALDTDPRSSLSLAIDGFVHCNLKKDIEGAIERYQLALAENANEPLAWLFLGTLHAFKGEGTEAMDAADRALALSPLDPMRYFFESLAATAALSAGQYERAIERARRSLRLNRMHSSTLRVITISQVQLGRVEEARATASDLLRLEPQLTVAGWLQRSPATGFATGTAWSQALATAGVPAG